MPASLAQLAPAHGHRVYEVEEVPGPDGLPRAELLGAVLADQDGGERAVLDAVAVSRAQGLSRVVLEKDGGQEIPVPKTSLVAFEQVALAGIRPGFRRRGEEEEPAARA